MKTLLRSSLLFLACITQLQAQQPNIILILADDLGYSDIGCYGSEIDTPNLDLLAAEGLRFRSFYSTGRCSPSRAALMTGHYSHAVGVGHLNNDWATPGYRGYLDTEIPTIAETLSNAGYYTGMCGKWHLGEDRPHWPIDRGFDRMFSSPKGGGYYFRPFETADRTIYDNETAVDLDAWEAEHLEEGELFNSTDAFTTMGMVFIDEALAESKPFFIFMSYVAPHWPLEASPEEVAKYLDNDYTTTPVTAGAGTYAQGYAHVRDTRFAKQIAAGGIAEALNGTSEEWTLSPRTGLAWTNNATREQRMALHAAVIDRMDRHIGRMMTKLDDPNGDGNNADSITDNTIIIFVSDNGCDSGGGTSGAGTTNHPDYGVITDQVKVGSTWANVSNTPFRRFKNSNQEGGIATPCIIRWPDGISLPDNSIVPTRGHLYDIAPTLMAAAGATIPTSEPQPSGVNLLPAFAGNPVSRANPLFFEHQGERAVIDSTGYKLMSQNNSSWELYNLIIDPQELNDLSASDTTRRDSMATIWFDWANENNVKDWPVLSNQRLTLGSSVDATHTPLQNGSFTVSSSVNSSNVDIYFDIAGTATPTDDYTALSSVDTLAGSDSRQFSIEPNISSPLDEPKYVEVTILPNYFYLEPANTETIWINPTTFAAWAALHLSDYSGFDASALGDPDNDGAPNYQEFGRGTDPTVADIPSEEMGIPTASQDGEHAVFSFLRGRASNEVTHEFELSSDLDDWEDTSSETTVMNESEEGDRLRVTHTMVDNISTKPKQFGRLRWTWLGVVLGENLINYSFTGNSLSPDSAEPGITGSDYNLRQSHLTVAGSAVSSTNEHVFIRSSVTNSTLEESTANAVYHEFSVDFSGNQSNLISLKYDHITTGGAFNSNIATYVSTDNFATSSYIGNSTISSTGSDLIEHSLRTLDLSTFSGTLSVRFYIFDDSSATTLITRIDDIEINGFATNATNPATQ